MFTATRKWILVCSIFFANLNLSAQNIDFRQIYPNHPYPTVKNDFIGVRYSSIAFSDIDGDNDLDVLITGQERLISVTKIHINDGAGNYSLKAGINLPGVKNGSVAFADIDGDNDDDLLITGESTSGAITNLYNNDGLGNYSLMPFNSMDSVMNSSIAFSDVDGDNDLDVLITGITDNNTRIAKLYLNDSLGNYSISQAAPFIGIEEGSIAFSDIDGDNDDDILIAGLDTSGQVTSTLYQNDGSGNFSILSGSNLLRVQQGSIAFEDVDGDNDIPPC